MGYSILQDLHDNGFRFCFWGNERGFQGWLARGPADGYNTPVEPERLQTWSQVEAWIDRTLCTHYPETDYAKARAVQLPAVTNGA